MLFSLSSSGSTTPANAAESSSPSKHILDLPLVGNSWFGMDLSHALSGLTLNTSSDLKNGELSNTTSPTVASPSSPLSTASDITLIPSSMPSKLESDPVPPSTEVDHTPQPMPVKEESKTDPVPPPKDDAPVSLPTLVKDESETEPELSKDVDTIPPPVPSKVDIQSAPAPLPKDVDPIPPSVPPKIDTKSDPVPAPNTLDANPVSSPVQLDSKTENANHWQDEFTHFKAPHDLIHTEHFWRAPQPGDSRSPCPALNALANHGYISRDGKDVTVLELARAIEHVYNLDYKLAWFLTIVGAVTCGEWVSLSLHELAKHNRIEHDGSLTRGDAQPEHEYAPTCVDKKRLSNFLHIRPGDLLTTDDLARVRAERDAALKAPLDWLHAAIAGGEVALIMKVFGNSDGTVPKHFLQQWLGEDRIPDGWVKGEKAIGTTEVAMLSKEIQAIKDRLLKHAGHLSAKRQQTLSEEKLAEKSGEKLAEKSGEKSKDS